MSERILEETPPCQIGAAALAEVKALCGELRAVLVPPTVAMSVEPFGDSEAARQAAQDVARSFVRQMATGQAGQVVALPDSPQWQVEWDAPGNRVLAALERLLELCGLCPEERAFVRALAERPGDRVSAEVFADWLEEQRRPEEAESLRRLTPADGDVLVMTLNPRVAIGEGERIMADLLAALRALGRDVVGLALPNGYTLERFDSRRLGDAGLARLDRLHEVDCSVMWGAGWARKDDWLEGRDRLTGALEGEPEGREDGLWRDIAADVIERQRREIAELRGEVGALRGELSERG